ncbi:Proteasomal ATPase-associated factor 1 [Cichlidogyrus casuarinus]|uniref:Proteasomal ATPase-associated factor 1 n=1 Tax=Cichlidogyrus casuarinus TaxID=1844966 RepID=A0ABD2QG03_9PLAT
MRKIEELYCTESKTDRCEFVSDNICFLSCSDDTLVRSTFQAPTSILTDVFKIERQPKFHISSFDVNSSGDLAIAATTNKEISIFETKTGLIRRRLTPNEAETTKAKFFPSGLVAMTAGIDMQLKIWCCVTSKLATTLKPGKAGSTVENCDLTSEPGGHTTAITDFDFIGLGRNVVSTDRLGYVRLWDVPTSCCYRSVHLGKGFSINGTFSNCIATSNLNAKSFCQDLMEDTNVPLLETSQNLCPFDVASRLIAVGTTQGLNILDPLSKSTSAFKVIPDLGPKEISSISFVHHSPEKKMSKETINLDDSQGSSSCGESIGEESPIKSSDFLQTNCEILIASGSAGGRVNIWDLRFPSTPTWSFGGENKALSSSVEHLKLFKWPLFDQMHSALKLGLIQGTKHGSVFVHNIKPQQSPTAHCLQLTGVDCEPISGLALVPMPMNEYSKPLQNSLGVWTGSCRGVFRHYDRLAVDTAFIQPLLAL